MHTRLETLDRPIERIARFYVERAKGGAGLIITGGFSPNDEGLMEPGAPILDSAEQIARASARHRGRARRRRADRAADPACRALRQGRRARSGPRPSPRRSIRNAPRRMSEADIVRTIEDYATTRGAGARGRLRRRRDHGHRRATSSTSSPRRAPTTARTTGAAASRTGCAWPSEIMRARARARSGRDFLVIFRVSSIDLVRGRADGRGDRRRRRGPSRRPAPTSSTRASAGTRRACRPSPRRCRARPGRSRRGA